MLDYGTYTAALANFLVIPAGDPNLAAAVPQIIDYAEQQSYRDLDLLNTVYRDSSVAFTAGVRSFTEANSTANGPFLVTQEINVITPATITDPEQGTRNPLLPATKEMLDFLYPSNAGAGVPKYFAPINQNTFVVGPWPDANYTIEVVGTQRPTPLSPTNTTTLLTVYFPDVFMNASLVYGAGYLKNFGAAQDDPQSGVSWKQLYDKSIASSVTEEARKRFQGQGWSPFSTGPTVTPPRT